MTSPGATSSLAGNCLGSFKLPDDVAFTIARGAGAHVWDTDGRRFYDYVMGSGPMALGHAHPRVVAAICEQAARGTHFYHVNERAQQLAERICKLVPCAESVKFCSDGSEATFYALRLARAFTRRSKIVKFDGAFHGHHDYARQTLKVGHGVNDHQSVPDSAGIPSEISDTVVIAPYNDIEGTRRVVAPIAGEIAAIILEPVQRGFMPMPGFLESVRQLADQTGALLVFDEVVTGFRLALGGGQELFGVTPDLCALGKIVGGGLPIAAVAGRRDVLELTIPGRPDDGRSVFMSGTLNGNPLGCAAGLATLDVIEEENVPDLLRQKGLALGDGLKEVARRLSIPFLTIGAPAFQQAVFGEGPIENAEAHAATNLAAARRFGVELVRRGILVVPGSKLYMSIAHNDSTQGAFLEAADGAMRAVRDQGLLN
jgi:glutamate-1-semialdehyde 2,1-aminomutase